MPCSHSFFFCSSKKNHGALRSLEVKIIYSTIPCGNETLYSNQIRYSRWLSLSPGDPVSTLSSIASVCGPLTMYSLTRGTHPSNRYLFTKYLDTECAIILISHLHLFTISNAYIIFLYTSFSSLGVWWEREKALYHFPIYALTTVVSHISVIIPTILYCKFSCYTALLTSQMWGVPH